MYALKNSSSDNAQIAHRWAQQSGGKAQAKGGNVFFEGRTIYSYGYHFPMAVFIKDNIVIINSDSYSHTTSNHQAYVRQALPDSCKRYYADTRICKIFIQDNVDKKHLKNALTEYLQTKLEHTFHMCSVPRIKQSTKAKHVTEFTMLFAKTQDIADLYKVKLPVKFKKAIETLNADLTSAIAQYEKAVLTAKKKQDKARQAEIDRKKVIALDAVKLWLNNEFLDYKHQQSIQYLENVYLRIAGENIETTKGAKFPVNDAIKLFPIIVECKQKSITWVRNHEKGHSLGHFTIDGISRNGDVQAGCHFVKWEQIEPVAKQLNLL